MSEREVLRLRVNGDEREALVPHERTLLDLLRDDLGLTGSKRGCDDGSCGTCTVLVDGEPRLACLELALLAEGADVTTIEGAGRDAAARALLEAFVQCGGLQCGYCTPGMVLAARALLDAHASPTEDEVREGLSNNICRCTGYAPIADAVKRAARAAAAEAAR